MQVRSRHHLCRVPVHHWPEINPQFRGQVFVLRILDPPVHGFQQFLGTTEAGIEIRLEGPNCHENYVLNVHNPVQLNYSVCNPEFVRYWLNETDQLKQSKCLFTRALVRCTKPFILYQLLTHTNSRYHTHIHTHEQQVSYVHTVPIPSRQRLGTVRSTPCPPSRLGSTHCPLPNLSVAPSQGRHLIFSQTVCV